jgi:hypothetical protein
LATLSDAAYAEAEKRSGNSLSEQRKEIADWLASHR